MLCDPAYLGLLNHIDPMNVSIEIIHIIQHKPNSMISNESKTFIDFLSLNHKPSHFINHDLS